MPKHWQKLALTLAAVALVGGGCTTSTETTDDSDTEETETATTTPTTTPTTPPKGGTTTGVEVGEPIVISATVEMSGDGFTPGSVTIKKGQIVSFKNVGSNAHWPASAPHPTHTDYPEFDPKHEIAPGQSWNFQFDKVGTWRFHDHLNSGEMGNIIVTE